MVTNKKKTLYLNWDFNKYRKTIAHSENCLPDLEIQSGLIRFAVFFKRAGSISRDSTFKFNFYSICKREE